MTSPYLYLPNFVTDPDAAFQQLRDDLTWERRSDAPRCEYYCNDYPEPYVYGKGRGRRAYLPQPYHPQILRIRQDLQARLQTVFETCFLNRYLNQSDHLGWHADDSPEMDDLRPIVSVSLGVARDIQFYYRDPALAILRAPAVKQKEITTLRLEHGSAFIMLSGFQDTHYHRIPKASFQCGERISLTYRGYLQGAAHAQPQEG
jgi:alkylated DNA repair dioxygenase AlkB